MSTSWKRLYGLIGRVELVLAATLLTVTVIMLLVLAISRIVNRPITGLLTLSLAILTWAIFIGADVAFKKEKIVHVDMLIARVPKAVQYVLQLLIFLAIAVFLVAVVYLGTRLAMASTGRTLPGTSISYIFVSAAVPVSAGLMLITTLHHAMQFLRTRTLYGASVDESGQI